MTSDPAPLDHLAIRAWIDPVVDRLGHDPRSPYVEKFWLGILGPSTTWLLRHLAAGSCASPDAFEIDLPMAAKQLGLGHNQARHSPFMRPLGRGIQVELAELQDAHTLALR